MVPSDILISIIIPFHNRIHLLERAIQSIQQQTFNSWELILVDDCSTETIRLNFTEFERIKLIYNKINLGPSGSRQRGLSFASGNYICFLDSDDVYQPRFLEKMLDMHLVSTNLSFSYCTSSWINQDGKIEGVYKKSDISFNTIMPHLLIESRPWNTSSIMWNKQFLPNWNDDFRTWEDYLIEFEASLINNKIGHVNENLCLIFKDENEGLSLLSENPVGVSHRSQVLRIMLNRVHNQNLVVRDEIIRRLIKDTIKCVNSTDLKITFRRLFLVLRPYSLLSNILSNKLHFLVFTALFKNSLLRRVSIKLKVW